MTSKEEGTEVARPRDSREDLLTFVCLVGTGSVVPGAVVLGFSPWFRRWNPLITRRDVFRKVFVTSAIGGCAGYVLAAAIHSHLVQQTEDESRSVMRKVREVLYVANKREFITSHLPQGDVIEQSSPSGDSHRGIESSPSLSISQRIFAQCYPYFTTSASISCMRSYLEQDLLANGTSQRDADIIITSLAHSLDSNDIIRTASSGGVVGVCAGLSAVLRERYPSALRGAPWVVRAPAFVGHALFLGFMYGAIVQAVGAQDATYADLVQDKRTVAAVLRAKFRQELEAGSSS